MPLWFVPAALGTVGGFFIGSGTRDLLKTAVFVAGAAYVAVNVINK